MKIGESQDYKIQELFRWIIDVICNSITGRKADQKIGFYYYVKLSY